MDLFAESKIDNKDIVKMLDAAKEIVLDENLKIILHYYNNSILAEILEEFSGYEGLGFIEIKNEVFQISVCI